ncbi:MAG: hypothetical protein MUF51_05075, partial [Vicinamibacteria bacterium]|nr:hypothetical protein [Vicinamibacteria bacterium]
MALLVALWSIAAFRDIGRLFYKGYHIPQGYGMTHLLPEELAHTLLFMLFGAHAMIGLGLALLGTSVIERLRAAF